MIPLSVVMAVRNAAPHVRDSIDSILNQTFSDFELLVVDDDSTDETADVLAACAQQDSRIRLLRNTTNLGPYPSANRALAEARGRLIARHDADDTSTPTRFATQMQASGDGVTLVTGRVERQPAGQHEIRAPEWQPALEWALLFGNVIGAGGHVMFPREIGGTPVRYEGRRRYAEDYELWCRLGRLGRIVSPPETVYCYRAHGGSITSTRRREQDACAGAIRHENQQRYLRSPRSVDDSNAISAFWQCEGDRPLNGQVSQIAETFEDLRGGFLDYVQRRYGDEARVRLDADIERQLDERFGYWLYRSAVLRDAKSWRELAVRSTARAPLRIGATAVKYGTGALMRRLS